MTCSNKSIGNPGHSSPGTHKTSTRETLTTEGGLLTGKTGSRDTDRQHRDRGGLTSFMEGNLNLYVKQKGSLGRADRSRRSGQRRKEDLLEKEEKRINSDGEEGKSTEEEKETQDLHREAQ